MGSNTRRRSESGQGMVEYGLIVGFMSVMALAALMLLGPELETMFASGADDDMLENGQAGVSSMLYVAAPAAAAAVEVWGTDVTIATGAAFGCWNQPLGTTRNASVTVDADKLAGASSASMTMNLTDIDFAGEVTISVNGGAPITVPMTGDGVTAAVTVTIPLNQLTGGANTVVYTWANNTGPPATQGYTSNAAFVTLTQ